MERGIHPTRLKQLGRHKSYAVLDVYLELGDPFEGHPPQRRAVSRGGGSAATPGSSPAIQTNIATADRGVC